MWVNWDLAMDDKLEEAWDLLGSLQAILSPVSPGNEGRSIFQSTMSCLKKPEHLFTVMYKNIQSVSSN